MIDERKVIVMENMPKPSELKPNKTLDKRPTIGFLTHGIWDTFGVRLWHGVMDVAQEKDANLICFLGGGLNATQYAFEAQANIVYDLANVVNVDGLVISSSALSSYAGVERLKTFCERYRPLPMVSIGVALAGIPAVLVDSYQGVREVMHHLIDRHGCRRLAFIPGPPDNVEAQERYRAYIETLSEYDLPFEPDLVAPPGDWRSGSGRQAIRILLDQRQVKFDAVVVANDEMAVRAMEELQARGVTVPDEVIVTGFNDTDETVFAAPPLTTIRQPIYDLLKQATQMVLAQLHGEQTPEQVILPTRLVIRQSCGCLDPKVMQAAAGPVTAAGESFKVALAARQEKILAEVSQAGGGRSDGLPAGWSARLLDAFAVEIAEKSAGRFLLTLDEILRQATAAGGDVANWHGVLSVLRRHTLPCLDRDEALRAEDLWQQARVMIGEMGKRVEMRQAWQKSQQARLVAEIGGALSTTFDLMRLMDLLAEKLPHLGFPGCYLSLYENPAGPTGWARLILGYNEQGRVAVDAGGWRFPSQQLAPVELLPRAKRYNLVVEPLYFQEHQLGFVVFEVGPRDGDIYEILRRELCSALHGVRLMQRIQERSAELARQQYILDTFMENIPDRIYFKDLNSRIIRANKAYAIRMGLTDPDELIGKSDFDFFPPDDAQYKYELEQQIIQTGQPMSIEERGVQVNGQLLWLLATKMPLRDENGRIIGTFGISRDITQLKQTQAALEQAYIEVEHQVAERTVELQQEITERKQAEEALRLTRFTVENVADAVYWMDAAARIVDVNQAACRMLGYTRAELTRMSLADIDPEFSIPRWPDTWKYLQEMGQLTREANHRTKDGRIIPVEIVANFIEFGDRELDCAFVRDITERKRAEALLERNLRETQIRLEISQALAGTETEDEVLDALIQYAGVYPQVYVAIYTLDQQGDELTVIVRRNNPFESDVLTVVTNGAHFPVSRFTAIRFLSPDQPFVSDNVFTDERVDPVSREVIRQAGAASFAAVPLTAGNEWLGFIVALAKSSGYFDEDKLHLYQTLAEQGGVALRAARLREAVRESQQRLSLLVQQSSLAVIEWNTNFEVAAWNPAAERIFGYRCEEALGRHARELIVPEKAWPLVDQVWQNLLVQQGGTHNINDNLTRDGRIIICEWFNVPLAGADGQVIGIASLVEDITERRRIEAELRTSEARYRALVESQIDLISRYLPDTTLTFVNDAYCKFYGKTREELIGVSYLTMVAPEFHEQAIKETQNFLQDPGPISGEYLNYRWDGRACWIHWILQGIVDEHGQVNEIQATGHDITRLKQVEQIIRQSEENYRDLYENAPSGYLSVSQEGLVGRCNRYLAEMLGYDSVDEIIGRPMADLYADTPHGQSKVRQIFQDVQARGTIPDEELQMQKRDGTPVWVNMTTKTKRDDEGQFPWTHSMVTNITERKQAEEKIHRLNEELEQRVIERTAQLEAANKELEAFSYSVSHDLRAPLRAIDGYTRILVEDYEAVMDAEGRRVCTVIRDETRRMSQLIDDLLAFSRLGRAHMQLVSIDMERLVQAVFDALTTAESREWLDFRMGGLPPAMGDPTLIRQVWTNLLANALKFSFKRERAVIEAGSRQGDGETVYWVRDNGAGFDMQYADKLFGVFQRLHSEKEFAGTGVGLAIVQRIIHRHGGRVWAEAEVDQGATFYFTLPR